MLATAAHRHSLQWRHNGRDCVSNHQRLDCLLKCLFRHISKKTSKLLVTCLCKGNSPVPGEFPTQKASNAENVSIWWRHHVMRDVNQGICLCRLHPRDNTLGINYWFQVKNYISIVCYIGSCRLTHAAVVFRRNGRYHLATSSFACWFMFFQIIMRYFDCATSSFVPIIR